MAKARGGKRYAKKWVKARGRDRYQVEIVEVYIRIGGRKHSSSYSIAKHGTAGANELADAWLAEKRELAAEHDAAA